MIAPSPFPPPGPSRRGHLLWILPVLALVAFGVYRHARPPAVLKPSPTTALVRTAPASRRDMPHWVSGIGTVTPLNVVAVKARVDGQLDRVAFTEGQMVKAGDLLAEIDPRPYRAALAQAKATVSRDDAQRRNAELDLQRYRKLSSLQVVPRQQLDAQKAQAESLLASVAADRGAADAAELNLSFTRITAPIAGRVAQRLVDQGAQVHASDATGLVTVTQIEPITVTFPVSQDLLADVTRAQGDGELAVLAMTRDGSATLANGRLVFIDSQVSAATGQVLLKAQFDNHDHALWPGAFVAAKLLLSTQAQAVTIPSQALQRDQTGDFVYVVDGDGRVTSRRVHAGWQSDGYTAVDEGVQAGERVVVEGQTDLQPGMHVTERPATRA
ncbi:MAG: Multidrug resistance protein MdtA [Luteibacter sp.]|uniref:efflux RND transporter periplasmic adaptor subunit n=1 Tax=Luteibacter sp. TaxID=1886636 RepID=UPI0013856740|nr:efflux RND transporter periplasmic adaptor subunit [Luteibacter sp.]KAF1004643.1 MAG: Multidrug resistance protein MdtA [Luteibacter sp.]